jgi:hypothetical protein
MPSPPLPPQEGGIGPATTCTIATAAVYTPLTLLFFYRELRSRNGKPPSCLRVGRRMGGLLEFYFDIPFSESGGLGVSPSNVHSETFRESNDLPFYIPPLSGALLQALGADTTLTVTTKRNRGSAAAAARGGLGASCRGDDSFNTVLEAGPARNHGRGTRVAPLPGVQDVSSGQVASRSERHPHSRVPRAMSRSERAMADDDDGGVSLDARVHASHSVEPFRRGPASALTPRHTRSMSMALPSGPKAGLGRAQSGRWSHHYTDPEDAGSPCGDGHAAFQPNRTAPAGTYSGHGAAG